MNQEQIIELIKALEKWEHEAYKQCLKMAVVHMSNKCHFASISSGGIHIDDSILQNIEIMYPEVYQKFVESNKLSNT